MTVTAPTIDVFGTALQAQVTAAQTLVNATSVSSVQYPSYAYQLDQLQRALVVHFMMTGWLHAGTNILASFSPPAWDKVGQANKTRIATLQTLVNNAPVTPPLPADPGSAQATKSIQYSYQQWLYNAQVDQVQHLMDLPGGSSAASMLSTLTGVQTTVPGYKYQYSFSSVGFTDEWIDD